MIHGLLSILDLVILNNVINVTGGNPIYLELEPKSAPGPVPEPHNTAKKVFIKTTFGSWKCYEGRVVFEG